jgi:hypothetical protein
MTLLAIAAVWVVSVTGLCWSYRQELMRLWREPVCRYPLLIVESDDWGAGPVRKQGEALEHLTRLLRAHRDAAGRHPVITLALILAVPDGEACGASGAYRRRDLGDLAFTPVRDAIIKGRAAGVFALQLHGMEHYWPPALMASGDAAVQVWRTSPEPMATEQLPSHLQSRWTDTSGLPSRALAPDAVHAAVEEETALFVRLFSKPMRVVVPPTFVWTAEVERAWASQGVEFIVTPGRRYTCRDERGRPGCIDASMHNGERGEGVSYVVRDDYFEPERGHDAAMALDALARKQRQGRACLLETHRSNFIGDRAVAERSFAALDELYQVALTRYPSLRFLSTEELGRALRDADPAWVVAGWTQRLPAWSARVREVDGFWRLARLSGLSFVIKSLQFFFARPTQ